MDESEDWEIGKACHVLPVKVQCKAWEEASCNGDSGVYRERR